MERRRGERHGNVNVLKLLALIKRPFQTCCKLYPNSDSQSHQSQTTCASLPVPSRIAILPGSRFSFPRTNSTTAPITLPAVPADGDSKTFDIRDVTEFFASAAPVPRLESLVVTNAQMFTGVAKETINYLLKEQTNIVPQYTPREVGDGGWRA
ncbi:hypothetical protein EYF80_042236 [Liparis tanakae]|uniref:Uncharacterized protein n=1 Tax=Liparis tanakae TaxID=230148 RepID=A0A4Z2G356_9TELE|nr:hypothetical protein EYF80_042236 [Liparis tanakae]